MAVTQAKTIDSSGFPLTFKTRHGRARPDVVCASQGRDVFVVEARQFSWHQKEAVVTEGASGSSWRIVSDEGRHLNATDLAPFPLGYFNAGLHADLINRLVRIAAARAITLDKLEVDVLNGYSMTGAFYRGDGLGFAEPTQIKVHIASTATADQVASLVADAVKASPAMAALRHPLKNEFAIYVNGHRRDLSTMRASAAPDAVDPFTTYAKAPQPLPGADDLADLVRKTGRQREGKSSLAPAGTTTRIIRTVGGSSTLIDPSGITSTHTYLDLPGSSYFEIKSDERIESEQGPSGLSLLSAAIAFCYMTQLSRYIEHMKYRIRAVRLVQTCPFTIDGNIADGSWTGGLEPLDTHLFLNGEESDETHETLLRIAANTCYLHATLADTLVPVVRVVHNGTTLDLPA